MCPQLNDNHTPAAGPDRHAASPGIVKARQTNPAGIYTRKFAIPPTARIAWAGSGFAQRMAERLKRAGFRCVDFEPPPRNFPEESLASFSFGTHSARFGDIATAAQLRQLAERAFGLFSPAHQIIQTDDGWVDLLRPSLEPEPFSCRDEAEKSLRDHLGCLKRLFRQSDLFIFAFGSTKAWLDRRDGTVFPVRPAPLDPENHALHHYGFAEIQADMRAFVDIARQNNRTMKVILIVAPDPSSDADSAALRDHAASVAPPGSLLRAVAAELEQADPLIDHFPSYDLIATAADAPQSADRASKMPGEPEMDRVMQHFFAQHPPPPAAICPPDTAPRRAPSEIQGP